MRRLKRAGGSAGCTTHADIVAKRRFWRKVSDFTTTDELVDAILALDAERLATGKRRKAAADRARDKSEVVIAGAAGAI